MTNIWPITERVTAIRNILLLNRPMLNIDFVCKSNKKITQLIVPNNIDY